jgi:hypothetical protein
MSNYGVVDSLNNIISSNNHSKLVISTKISILHIMIKSTILYYTILYYTILYIHYGSIKNINYFVGTSSLRQKLNISMFNYKNK